MKLLKNIALILAIAAIGYGVHVYFQWPPFGGSDGNFAAHAERDCRAQIRSRHAATSVSVYRVDTVPDGYRVRASARISGERSVRMICLANEYGRVEDIEIEER